MAEWKKITYATHVMKVPGGMVMLRDQSRSDSGPTAMVFVPDYEPMNPNPVVRVQNLLEKWIEENSINNS
jgi:hypothetical protein